MSRTRKLLLAIALLGMLWSFASLAATSDEATEGFISLNGDGDLLWDRAAVDTIPIVTDATNILTLDTSYTSATGRDCSIPLTLDEIFYLRDLVKEEPELGAILQKIAPKVRVTVSFGLVEDE
jgi:hypothetical protein